MNTKDMKEIAARAAGSNNPIDALGLINAKIAELTDQAEPLKEEIKGMGVGTHDGIMFSANVADVAPSESFDAAAMEEKLRDLGVDDRWFNRHIKVKKGYMRLSVKDRK